MIENPYIDVNTRSPYSKAKFDCWNEGAIAVLDEILNDDKEAIWIRRSDIEAYRHKLG